MSMTRRSTRIGTTRPPRDNHSLVRAMGVDLYIDGSDFAMLGSSRLEPSVHQYIQLSQVRLSYRCAPWWYLTPSRRGRALTPPPPRNLNVSRRQQSTRIDVIFAAINSRYHCPSFYTCKPNRSALHSVCIGYLWSEASRCYNAIFLEPGIRWTYPGRKSRGYPLTTVGVYNAL